MPFSESHGLDRELLARGLRPLFGDLPDDLLLTVAENLEPRRLLAGEILVRQGEPGNSIHIVLSGRLRASVTDSEGNERDVAEIGVGESAGETSLLTRQPHSVTYRALRDSVVARMSQTAFVELSHTHPGLLWTVTGQVTQRLKQARDGSVRNADVRTVAVLYLDDRVRNSGFRDLLTRSLQLHGPTTWIDTKTAADGPSGNTEAWLDHLEASHRFVMMELDSEATPWSRLCIRQADRILLVASSDGDPDPTMLERELREGLPPDVRSVSELVLIAPEGASAPSGTAAWLADRDLLRHQHVREGNVADHERLARFLAGKAVGLVLAGGGAKAFVHLGVLQALHESRVPIDLVGGTSMGAILAAAVATGLDHEEIVAHCRVAFTSKNPLTDYAFPPLISMMRGRRIEKLLREFFGESDIEDLQLPYLCISGDFTMGQMAIHRTGTLWRAIKASISLPGILPPTVIDGHLHVDGGTFDNFPVEPVRAAGAGRIVASDIWVPRRPDLGYEDTPSGMRFFVERYLLRRSKMKVPHVMTTLFRSSFLASHERRRAAKQGADLFFSSPSGRVGLTHWKKLDDAMAAGYSHAKRRIEEAGPEALVNLGVPEDEGGQSMSATG